MTTNQKLALLRETRHWERLISGNLRPAETATDSSRALCNSYKDAKCRSCPVKQYTGKANCIGTPMESAKRVAAEAGISSVAFKAVAKLSLAFLRSLQVFKYTDVK